MEKDNLLKDLKLGNIDFSKGKDVVIEQLLIYKDNKFKVLSSRKVNRF